MNPKEPSGNSGTLPPDMLTLRMEVDGLKIVATAGNGRFLIGEKYHYVPEALLAQAKASALESVIARLESLGEYRAAEKIADARGKYA